MDVFGGVIASSGGDLVFLCLDHVVVANSRRSTLVLLTIRGQNLDQPSVSK